MPQTPSKIASESPKLLEKSSSFTEPVAPTKKVEVATPKVSTPAPAPVIHVAVSSEGESIAITPLERVSETLRTVVEAPKVTPVVVPVSKPAAPTVTVAPVVTKNPSPTPAKQKTSHLLDESFEKIKSALAKKEISAVELAKEAYRRTQLANPELNAYISVLPETEVLKQAEHADKLIAQGVESPILGIPLALKDLILMKGFKTTAGSKMLHNFVAPYDATVTAKIKAAAGVVIGKTNLDEFAMGSSNESSFAGVCKNPWDLTRVPGGSSGGSASAVASRCVPLSLGTDTGGSIRQPASLTGITGIKPTYGRVSRFGVVAYASSLDQVGPMCSDALGCAAMLEVISGHDPHDATSPRKEVPNFYSEAQSYAQKDSLKGLRVGLPKEFFSTGLNAEVEKHVRASIDKLKEQGAELVEVDLPHTRFAIPAYYMISTSEASSNLARYDGIHFGHRTSNIENATLEDLYARSRGEGFGDETRLRVLLGTFALSSGYYEAYYKKASQVRTLIKKDFELAFQKCDVIAGPTSPTTAFKIGEKTNDPVSMYLNDIYTLSTNLAGLPGLSFNVGFDSAKLPVGLQIMTPWWNESLMLGIAAWYQKRFPDIQALPDYSQKLFSSGGVK